MVFISNFGKKATVLALAFATLLGNKISAMSTVATLVSTYAATNEFFGDTGLVNHPAMGRYTLKKTIEYFMRDVKKEEALIDQIIEFIDESGADRSLEKNVEIERYSGNIEGREDQIKSDFLASLMKLKDLLINTKKALSEGFGTYCLGMYKFDLSKNSIFISILDPRSIKTKEIAKVFGIKVQDFDFWSSNITTLGNVVCALNKDGSLTVKLFVKKLNIPDVPNMNNFTSQFTISAPGLAPAPVPKK